MPRFPDFLGLYLSNVRTEARHYFSEFHERCRVNGVRQRNVRFGFRTDLFESGDLIASRLKMRHGLPGSR